MRCDAMATVPNEYHCVHTCVRSGRFCESHNEIKSAVPNLFCTLPNEGDQSSLQMEGTKLLFL